MARLKNKALFFTTSPRTPTKMIPEIKLLTDIFSGQPWNKVTQASFMTELAKSDFFEGSGSSKEQAFSARDRITRAPKALGFVDLKPKIALTNAGTTLIFGKRPHEAFLRQLLKFQLPSPYHVESKNNKGTFFVRPYLEIMRLIKELEYITFDECKIFALQLTDYRRFVEIKEAIKSFRADKEDRKGEYKRFVNDKWTEAVIAIYKENITHGNLKTRETNDASLKTFIATKKSNLRDYADACFRYLRYTGLFAFSGHSIHVSSDKFTEVDYILNTVERQPVFINNETAYKAHLFSASEPMLYVDIKDNIVDILMRIGSYTKRELINKEIEELKDLRDDIIKRHKEAVINKQINELKSYSLYSEIIDTYNEIIADEYYDAPLMFEYNTWRAMTMLDGGYIKGNFKFDDSGQPLSTAQGNMPDIECDYGDFILSVEVTLQAGQRQYESEGEPVARHFGQMRKRTGKDTFCLFIAPNINLAVLAHFFALNKMEIAYYGGKTQIIPLELNQFMKLVENSYTYVGHPTPKDVYLFLKSVIEYGLVATNETEWYKNIQLRVDNWLVS